MERLSWRDKFVRQLVQNLTAYNEADCEGRTPLVLSGDDNIVILRVSLDEWIKLYSSVFTGSDICYPDESDNVRWILNRAIECPVDLCALIADCIANSEGTQAALRAFVNGDDAIQQNIENIASQQVLSAENRAANLLKPDACDDGYTFNMASVAVQLLHDVTEDLFEAVEVGTNALERASIITSGIPVFGQVIPADEILQFADQLVEEIAEDYIGAYDEALYDTIRCDIWCLIKDDCDLSIDRLITYYEDALGEALPDDPFQLVGALVSYLNIGDFGTDAPVYAMHLLVLSLIRLSSDVFGIDFGKLALRITAAGDDINNDYSICECYVPPAGCVDLRDDAYTWIKFGDAFGVYVSGQGLAPSTTSGNPLFIWNRPQETGGPTVNEVIFYFNMAQTNMRITMGVYGTVIRDTDVDNKIVLNEANAPSLFPADFASMGALQIRGNATNGLVTSASLRMWQFCYSG